MRPTSAPEPAWEQDIAPLNKRERGKLVLTRIVSIALPVLMIGGAIAGFMVMGAMKPQPEEKEEVVKAIPVLTAMATQDNVTLKVRVQGEVQPHTQINLVPQVGGKISYMSPKFIEGGKFRKGDLLVRVEPAEYELRVVQARANVAQAETVVMRERSEGEIARQDWEELGRAGEPTPLTLRQPQLAEARAQLASAEAQLAEAELQLSRASLYAPFNGRVTMRHIDAGEFVTAGTRLGEIYATDIMDVRLPMTNADLRQAGLTLGYEAPSGSAGIPVKLSADVAGRMSEWQGRIVRTDSRFDAETRVLFAYAEVIDPFGKGSDDGVPLAPGIFVNADIEGQTLENIISIPRAALRGADTVYVANADETLTVKTVSVVSSDRNTAILSEGLNSGTSVITSPIRGVADGMKVAVVETLDIEADDAEVTP
ncbi:efflux RND transporter periplasmic adaptor subunit [Litorimonas sp. WD9-15]|uniref:efflux RND transporter periplasmic adaptor subunit n=1 Tax=Litorimonas sp. WD9-15 TaxID=3418716 RepID=UPI003D00629F